MRIAFHTAMFPELRAEWQRPQVLGFGYLAAALHRAHPGVEVILARDEEELFAARPDLVGLTAVTFTWSQARRIAALVHERLGVPVVVGGPHVTALPERLGPEFDYAVLGEGEVTLTELVSFLKDHPAPSAGAFPDHIAGLVFWRAGERVINAPRPLIEPLDSLPHPDRELFNHGGALDRGSIYMMASRGCAYDCNFCATTRHWHRLRTHSPEYILEELDAVIRRYRPWQIIFDDDLFIADRRRVQRIAEGILSRGHQRRVCFHVQGRVNLINDEICALLRQINCHSVFIGFESVSDRVLATLGKNKATGEASQRAVDTLRRHGIKVIGSFILGSPGETFADLHASYAFVKRNLDAFSHVDANVLRLLPGTALWQEGLRRGLVDEHLTGIVFDEQDIRDGWGHLNHRYPMLCDGMTRNELLAMMLAFQELSALVRECNAGPRRIENAGIRALGAELYRRVLRKLPFGR